MGLNVGYLSSDKNDNELYTPFYAVEHIFRDEGFKNVLY